MKYIYVDVTYYQYKNTSTKSILVRKKNPTTWFSSKTRFFLFRLCQSFTNADQTGDCRIAYPQTV